MTPKSLLAFLAAALLCAAIAIADQNPSIARGFSPEGVYHFGDVDSVNTMNGNLVISIPLGGKYRAGDGLGYSLTLTYNSNFWDHRFTSSGTFGGLLDPLNRPLDSETQIETIPRRAGNAGIGWTLSLGTLRYEGGESAYRWAYIGADGAEHQFYAGLHENDNGDTSGAIQYSRDSSYLKMVRSGVATSAHTRVIWMPDGTRQTFSCPGVSGTNVRFCDLTEVRDLLNNVLSISRSADGLIWTLQDGSRTHVIKFENSPSPHYRPRVDYVEVGAYDPNNPSARAHYEFNYATAYIYRDGLHSATSASSGIEYPYAYRTNSSGQQVRDGTIQVDVLTEVVLPTGHKWQFGYIGLNPPVGTDGSRPTNDLNGRLSQLTLPIGGQVRYTYSQSDYLFPTMANCVEGRSAQDPMPIAAAFTSSVGVIRRARWDRDGTFIGRTLYIPQSDPRWAPNPTGPCTTAKEHTVTVVDQLANISRNFFWVDTLSADADQNGLPYSRVTTDAALRPTADSDRYLSQRTYQCSRTGAPSTSLETTSGIQADYDYWKTKDLSTCPGGILRSHYVRYEWSGIQGDQAPAKNTNRRLASEATYYHDDLLGGKPVAAITDYTDFDGLGHYRRKTVRGNFGLANNADGGALRTDDTHVFETKFNQVCSLGGPCSTGNYSKSIWFLGDYTETIDTFGGSVRSSRFLFDPNLGFLTAVRTRKNGTANSMEDLLTRYSRSTLSGISVTERYYGGDGAALDTTEAGLFNAPGLPRYQIRKEWQSGAVANAYYQPPNNTDSTSLLLTIETNRVHAQSGLVTMTTDASGRRTSYGYDFLGRLTSQQVLGDSINSVVIPAEDILSFGYSAAGVAPFARMTQSGIDVTYKYDGFGRTIEIRSNIPPVNDGGTGRVAVETFYYNPNDLKDQVSTRYVSGTTPHWTTYRNYDPFGRPRQIEGPDGSITNFGYNGDRLVRRSVLGVMVEGVATTVDTFTAYDREGRVIRAADWSDPAITTDTTKTLYDYDVHGLQTVVQGSQTRTFQHDGRGFLDWETHPEITGRVDYSYDARGHVVSRTYSGASAGVPSFNLTYNYDNAERLLSVLTGAATVKQFTYYTSNNECAGLALGKIKTATRYNNVPQPGLVTNRITVAVTQQFKYEGVGGRVSNETLTVNNPVWTGNTTATFSTSYNYTLSGDVASISYPGCGGACSGSVGRTVTFTYGRGNQLTMVGGLGTGHEGDFANWLTYAGNGMIQVVKHANGATDTFTPDASGLVRPASIAVTNAAGATLWSSGAYVYDPLGNITSIGTDSFRYDKASRLKRATIGASTTQQTYDRWGNLLSYSSPSGTASFAISGTSNRLSGTNIQYDHAGNQTRWQDPRQAAGSAVYAYEFDPLNRMIHATGTSLGKVMVYDSADERVGVLDYVVSPHKETWSIRGLGKEVLRDFALVTGSGWSWQEDYIHRGGPLLATIAGNSDPAVGTRHFHLDHLGTPRLLTTPAGAVASSHSYQPFGEEITADQNSELATPAGAERMKFTGHERDNDNPALSQTLGDLDSMHARHYNPMLGRFLSVDPLLDLEKATRQPQMWNRYAYVVNNPVLHTDPDGREHVQEPGFTKPMTAENLAMDENTPAVVKGAFYAEAFLFSLAADEFVIGPAIGKVAGAVGRLAGRFFGKAEEAIETGAKLSRYDDTTIGRSIPNRATDVSREEFAENLEANGFTKTTSKSGKVTNFEKDGVKYSLRDTSKSTGGPSADVFKDGEPLLKIRLEVKR